ASRPTRPISAVGIPPSRECSRAACPKLVDTGTDRQRTASPPHSSQSAEEARPSAMTSCSRRYSLGPLVSGTSWAVSSLWRLWLGSRIEGLQQRLAVRVGDRQVLTSGRLARQEVFWVRDCRLPTQLLNDVIGGNANDLAAITSAVRVGGIEARAICPCGLRPLSCPLRPSLFPS